MREKHNRPRKKRPEAYAPRSAYRTNAYVEETDEIKDYIPEVTFESTVGMFLLTVLYVAIVIVVVKFLVQ